MNGILQIIIYSLFDPPDGFRFHGKCTLYHGSGGYYLPHLSDSPLTAQLVMLEHEASNGDYDSALLLYGAVGSIIVREVYIYESYTGILSGIGVVLLIILTVFRYYADVEYRLNLNYKRYFIYYALYPFPCYLAALGFCHSTGSWHPVFILGESAALAPCCFSSEVFHNFLQVKIPHSHEQSEPS